MKKEVEKYYSCLEGKILVGDIARVSSIAKKAKRISRWEDFIVKEITKAGVKIESRLTGEIQVVPAPDLVSVGRWNGEKILKK